MKDKLRPPGRRGEKNHMPDKADVRTPDKLVPAFPASWDRRKPVPPVRSWSKHWQNRGEPPLARCHPARQPHTGFSSPNSHVGFFSLLLFQQRTCRVRPWPGKCRDKSQMVAAGFCCFPAASVSVKVNNDSGGGQMSTQHAW